MNKEEIFTALDSFAERLGGDDETLNTVQEIRNEINSRDDEIERLSPFEGAAVDKNGKLWTDKYAELSKRYRERFYTTAEEIKEDQKTNIQKDDVSTIKSISELFREREGN